MTEARRAQTYAKNVADAMLALRGYRRLPSREMVDDVFACMAEHDRLYTSYYARGVAPSITAERIQHEIWGC